MISFTDYAPKGAENYNFYSKNYGDFKSIIGSVSTDRYWLEEATKLDKVIQLLSICLLSLSFCLIFYGGLQKRNEIKHSWSQYVNSQPKEKIAS